MKYLSNRALLMVVAVVSCESYASDTLMHKQAFQSLEATQSDDEGCKIVQQFVQSGGDVNMQLEDPEDRQTLLHAAVNLYPKYNTVKLLLESRANPNIFDVNGWTPLHTVTGTQPHMGLVRLLLSYNADVDQENARGLVVDREPNTCCFKQSPLDSVLLARELYMHSGSSHNPSNELIRLLEHASKKKRVKLSPSALQKKHESKGQKTQE